MEGLINLLHTEDIPVLLPTKEKSALSLQRGVADIYDLLTQEPEFFKGASIADKVVGKELPP